MRTAEMEFHYGETFTDQDLPEAYERLLQDALDGDPSLFIRSDHIEEAWRIVDPLLHAWEQLGDQYPLVDYPRGSWGPDRAQVLVARDGNTWAPVCGHSEPQETAVENSS